MKLLLVTLVLVGLAIFGAQQVSYFADPALECTDIKEKINKTHITLKEQEKRLLQLKSDQSMTANLTRQQFSAQYQRHVRLFAKLDEISSGPEGRRISECNTSSVRNKLITYSDRQLNAFGIEIQ